ncbi:hypothetical protein CDL12_30008 [Handroanthus impetiginosus]|uniref:Transmembrane protein n=1 Tax=Handroanthus impetiginosus TaxID=429701 RepID=A0A2G9FX64_9LAMI|nr:hypothetical protein CDL12_30008 [Handroanthus impetiginosus]
MSRRPNTARRLGDNGSIPFVGALHPKSRPSPLLSIGIFVVGSLLIVGYLYHGSGSRNGDIGALSRLDGNFLFCPYCLKYLLNETLDFIISCYSVC